MKQFLSDITNFAKTRKFWVALVGLFVNELVLFYAANPPSWLTIVIALLTALGVYQVPNKVNTND